MNEVFVADIGGTHTRFGVMRGTRLVDHVEYHTHMIKRIGSMIKRYLMDVRKRRGYRITKGCIAVAGPVINQRAHMIHERIIVDAKRLKVQLELKALLVINDFVAVSFAVSEYPKLHKRRVNRVRGVDSGTRVVIGPGTGLGKAIIHIHGKHGIIYPSEGGHGDLAVHTDEEIALLRYLGKGKAVSWERVLSGDGIMRVHGFVCKKIYPCKGSCSLGPYDIFAKYGKDTCCTKAVKMFMTLLARASKNMALEHVALGGVYIAGGVAMGHARLFGPSFMKEFADSKDFHSLLKTIPVSVITDEHVGLIGAGIAIKRM